MWLSAAIALLTAIAFAPAIQNGFTDWDDPWYVAKNDMVRDLSPGGLKAIFSTRLVGNYQPLTVASFALDYHFWKLDPRGYHISNVVLHVLNTLAVFWLILLLTGSTELSAITSLFFGIHPLHVESVAWVSGRKDVLYAFFYVGACISYVLSIRKGRLKTVYYLGSLALFGLSILSKAMAVSLPLVLVAIDFYSKRKVSLTRLLVEKIPFLLLAMAFGIVAVMAQKSQGAIQDIALFPFYERILFACYGILTYLFRAVAPVHLSAFYPYPLKVGGFLPPVYYFAPLILAVLVAAVIKSLRHTRAVAFGALFFFLNVALVLQLFPVGSAIVADRYTYLSYIGVGFILASGYRFMIQGPWARQKAVATAMVVVLSTVLVFATRARCEVWKDDVSLWTDVIGKYPNLPLAYTERARFYMRQGQDDRAMVDLERAVSMDPENHDALTNRGTILFQRGNSQGALTDLRKAVKLDPRDAVAWNSLGAVHSSLGERDSALTEFDRAIEAKKDFAEAYFNRALTLATKKQFGRSLSDYDVFIRLQPGNAKAHLWRGLARQDMGDTTGAIEDYGRALTIDPKFGEAQVALERLRGGAR